MRLARTIILLIIVLVSGFSRAIAQKYYLKHFSVDDGLPSNEVYHVLEDNNGYLLVATDRGIGRFNGYSFEPVPVTSTGSISNSIFYLYRSDAGKIYCSGIKGLLYEYKQSQLDECAFNVKTTALYRHPGILIANSISINKDTFWISFNNDYNYNFRIGSCFVSKNNEVKKLQQPDGLYFDLKNKFYHRQLIDSICLHKNQPLFITWENKSVTKDTVNISWPGAYIRRLFYQHVGNLDVFSIGRKLLIYRDHKKMASYLFEKNTLYLEKFKDTQLFIGFENGGVSLFNVTNEGLSPPVQTYIDNLSVNCVYHDKQGGLWLATMEDGLYYASPSDACLLEFHDKIQFIEKRNGLVYVGEKNGKLTTFRQGNFVSRQQLPLPKGTFLMHLSFTNDNTPIVITNKGFQMMTGKTWKTFSTTDLQLIPSEKNTFYGADAIYPQVHIYPTLTSKEVKTVALPKRIISMLYENNTIWLGTMEGLYSYSKGNLTNLTGRNIFRDRIVAIKKYGPGYYAFASLNNGLALYKKGGAISILDASNGLITPIINSMDIEDSIIWLGTNKGLARVLFDGTHFHVNCYGLEDGLPTIDIHEFKVQGNWLYLKWLNQLVRVPIGKLTRPQEANQTLITSVILNKKQQVFTTGTALTHDDNDWQFNFISPNLSSANKQAYYYKLEGFDSKWSATRERNIRYTNLPPGSYTFKVKVNPAPGGTLQVAAFSFTIPPAFWQTTWFLISVLLLSTGLIFLLFRLRIQTIKQNNQMLLDLAESKQKMLVELIKPHFVFNVLNTVQSAILKQDKIGATSIISRFAKLLRMSLEAAKENFVTIENEIELLKNYFELENIRSPGRFAYKIQTNNIPNYSKIEIPSMLLQPFVENAIKHGVRNLIDKKGDIDVSFQMEKNNLVCRVEDNGVGRKNSLSLQTNQDNNHKSVGIEITVNRLKLLHFQQKSAFFFEIKDRVTSTGKSMGTSVVFSVPYKIST